MFAVKTSALLGFAVGPIATAALGFISVPLIAWLFSSEDVGRLNVLQMTCSFAMIVFTLGLDQAYIREYHVVQSKELLLKHATFPVLVVLLIATVVAVTFGEKITLLLFKSEDSLVFLGLLLAVWATLLLRISSTVLRMQERGWQFSLAQLLNRVLLLILCGGVYVFSDDVTFSILALVFAVAILGSTALACWFARREILASVASPMPMAGLPQLLRFGIPLVVSGFFYWGLTASGTFALSQLSTLKELGIYSVALSFGAAATIFQQIFTVIWAPTVYKWLAEEVELSRIAVIEGSVLSIVALLLCFAGMFSWLIEWLLPREYIKVKFYVLCTLVPPLFYTLSEVTAIGIGVSRKTWLNTLVSALAFSVNVVLCVYLVPKYGAAGAVVANTLAYSTFLIARTEAARCVWHKTPRSRLYIATTLMSLGACATVYAGERGFGHISAIWLVFFFVIIKVFSPEYLALLSKVSAFYRKRRDGFGD
jgi:O-antigen/teichoic acid export membrane protein